MRGRDVREERKGPRVGAPEAAVQGFLKAAGLASLDQATIVSDPKKGDSYVAIIEKPGQETIAAIAEIVPAGDPRLPLAEIDALGQGLGRRRQPALGAPAALDPLHLRRRDRGAGGGAASRSTASSPATSPMAIASMRRGAITVRRFDDYVASLEKAKVVLDADRRKEIILADARNLAFAQGLELVEDEGLLEEVAGLVEWPVVLMGAFEERFLEIPGEAIRATIRANQKCFVLRDPATGALANRFLLISNLDASDGGKAIVAGNERVVRARLSDAAYFFATDKGPLPDLDTLQGQRREARARPRRSRSTSAWPSSTSSASSSTRSSARKASACSASRRWRGSSRRSSAPIRIWPSAPPSSPRPTCRPRWSASSPNLQGLMGRKYAELQGENASVAAAIEEHYKPLGPSDRVPTDPVSVAVALADKLDTLVGFWAIDEKPTGSKDPYALRRAALGVIRLVVENGVRLRLEHRMLVIHASSYDLILKSARDLQSQRLRSALADVSLELSRDPRCSRRCSVSTSAMECARLAALIQLRWLSSRTTSSPSSTTA